MTRIAVFPGQGAQAVGMGQSFAAEFAAARSVFDEVDAAIGMDLSRLIASGPDGELTLTANAQPALMATALAAVRGFEARSGRPLADCFDYAAGHSLGEYTALTAAGALPLADTARLLRRRGEAMQEATPTGTGAMAAILGLSATTVEELAAAASQQGEPCELANDNADGQAVVSGARPAVERAVELAREKGAKRALLLQVSAPFHCSLMAPAARALEGPLARQAFAAPAWPIIANVLAEPVDEPARLRALLLQQITARVRWRESMATMRRLGVTVLVEFGPGRVLAGLARRALPEARVIAVQTTADLDEAVAALAA